MMYIFSLSQSMFAGYLYSTLLQDSMALSETAHRTTTLTKLDIVFLPVTGIESAAWMGNSLFHSHNLHSDQFMITS